MTLNEKESRTLELRFGHESHAIAVGALSRELGAWEGDTWSRVSGWWSADEEEESEAETAETEAVGEYCVVIRD